MVHLIAKERFPYAGSELLPGQHFEETESYAMILTALGKADYVTRDETPAPAVSPATPEPSNNVPPSLREQAHALGVRVDGRWSDKRLRAEIDAARSGRYSRRDLRAED